MAVSEIVTDPSLQIVLEAAERARQQCLDLLQLLERAPEFTNEATTEFESELSTQQKHVFARLSQLRAINRNAILGIRQTKQATAESRHEVDMLHLQLQNLYYEQRHLRGEIAACEDYDHKYQQLPLIPVEEFLELFPEHQTDDEHQLMIARINHEHAERQALEEQRQGLLKEKQGLIAENKKRKDDLANIDKDLEKFIEAATPIIKTFEKEY